MIVRTDLFAATKVLRAPLLLIIVLSGFSVVFSAWANAESAEQPTTNAKAFISNLSQELEKELKQARKENVLSDDAYLDKLIENQILPHLDIPYMARKIGDSHWDKIKEKSLQKDMQEAVINALKRTYRVALASYSGEKIMITHSKNYADYSLVRIEIATDKNTHKLDFALRSKSEEWKVFDVSVDGVVFSRTMQKSLKSQFENKTIEEVIENLNGKPIA